MAGTDRSAGAALIRELFDSPRTHTFVQVIRLLRRFMQEGGATVDSPQELFGSLRVRPELTLGFPAYDVAEVQWAGRDPWRFDLTVTFMGLYGTGSPLPTFYTEELLEEYNDGSSVSREFIDVLNSFAYSAWFRIWSRYRLDYALIEGRDPRVRSMLECLAGLGMAGRRGTDPRAYEKLRYLGLLTQQPRSADGLQSLLRDRFSSTHVFVEQCVPRRATIPADQQLRLGTSGHELGADSFLGYWVSERIGKFSVRVGPVSPRRLTELLPGAPLFKLLADYVRFYVNQPLEWELAVEVRTAQMTTVQLGSRPRALLGLTTWVFAGHAIDECVCVRFAPGPPLQAHKEAA